MLISVVLSGLRHRGSWQRLKFENHAIRKRGTTEGTWGNKISHLRQYLYFTHYFRVQDFPVQLGVLLRFIPFLGRDPISYSQASNVIPSLIFLLLFWTPLLLRCLMPFWSLFPSKALRLTSRGLCAKSSLSRLTI